MEAPTEISAAIASPAQTDHPSLLVFVRERRSQRWVLPEGGPHLACVSLQEWNPHYFVLTSSKIYYSGETTSDQGNEDEEEQKEVRAALW